MFVFVFGMLRKFRHRIIPAIVPRMATANTLHCQPATADYTKTANGFNRITGTSWCVPAMWWQKRADTTTVKLDYTYGNFAHNLFQCCDSESNISWLLARRVASRAITTKSAAGSCGCCRKLSLTSRFILLRSSARLACFFEIANPSRGVACPVLVTARMVNNRSLDRIGSLKTRLNSAGFSSRARLGKRAIPSVISRRHG